MSGSFIGWQGSHIHGHYPQNLASITGQIFHLRALQVAAYDRKVGLLRLLTNCVRHGNGREDHGITLIFYACRLIDSFSMTVNVGAIECLSDYNADMSAKHNLK